MNLLRVSREVEEFRKRYKWMALGVSMAFAVLLMNLAAPLIERWTRPRVYGRPA